MKTTTGIIPAVDKLMDDRIRVERECLECMAGVVDCSEVVATIARLEAEWTTLMTQATR